MAYRYFPLQGVVSTFKNTGSVKKAVAESTHACQESITKDDEGFLNNNLKNLLFNLAVKTYTFPADFARNNAKVPEETDTVLLHKTADDNYLLPEKHKN